MHFNVYLLVYQYIYMGETEAFLGGGTSEIEEVVWICEEPKAMVSFHIASSIFEASHQSKPSLNI